MIKKIEELLINNSSNKQKDFSNKLIPNALPMIGVKIPILKNIARDICNDDYKAFLNINPNTFEMQMLKAFVIAKCPITMCERFKYLDEFIPTIKDWSIHDSLISALKCSIKYPDEMYEYVLKYKNSKNEFEVRFVSIMLMSYYLNDEYIDQVINILDNLYLKDYYAKMGVAWCVATMLYKYPEKTIKYLENNNLDNWTINKAISKARESYRVTKEVKDYILRFKK